MTLYTILTDAMNSAVEAQPYQMQYHLLHVVVVVVVVVNLTLLTDRYESSRDHKIDGTKPNQTGLCY